VDQAQTRCLNELIEAAWRIVEYAKWRVHDDNSKRLEAALLQADIHFPVPAEEKPTISPTA
jgi:hypothetical protein